ncbi:MAG: PH domain-containing protein [Bryobacterales bacterium]|nr:PH domain-containing protein [Bryobacteraceae bacterium]MDW8355744.1 PH domain-containing protein [Bryobacterales bacterium]
MREAVAETVIRPSMKLIRAAYWAVFLVLFLSVLAYVNNEKIGSYNPAVLLIPAALLLFPIRSHLRQHFTRLTLTDGKLRYETGIVSRSSRSIPLAQVQNVRVDQTLFQRLLRVGDISVETAGETSLLVVKDLDDPEAVADLILGAAPPRSRKEKSE